MHTTNYSKTKPHKYYILSIFCHIFISIFCLCFHHVADASDPAPSLAQRVFEKYSAFFQREDIQEVLPTFLEEVKKPESQKLLTPNTINIVVDTPSLLKGYISTIDDKFITGY